MSEQINQVCPACSGHSWPSKVRGRRTCPQCAASVALTKTGPRLLVFHRFHRQGGRPAPTAVERMYRVMRPDNATILCACCAQPTSLIGGIDGRIETDGTSRMNVQTGWTFTGSALAPRFEQRQLPRIIRGIICPACQSRFPAGFKPIRQPGTVDRRPLRVTLPNFNTRAQRLEAEAGEMALALARFNGADDPEMAVSLIGANWAHTGDPSWITPALLPESKRPNGFNTGSYYRARDDAYGKWIFRPAVVLSRKPTAAQRELALSVFKSQAGRAHIETVEPFDPIADLDAARYRGKLPIRASGLAYWLLKERKARHTRAKLDRLGRQSIVERTTGLLPAHNPPVGVHLYLSGRCAHGLTPVSCALCLSPDYTLGTAKPSAMVIEPSIRQTSGDGTELPVKVHFSSRPLLRRAIPLKVIG